VVDGLTVLQQRGHQKVHPGEFGLGEEDAAADVAEPFPGLLMRLFGVVDESPDGAVARLGAAVAAERWVEQALAAGRGEVTAERVAASTQVADSLGARAAFTQSVDLAASQFRTVIPGAAHGAEKESVAVLFDFTDDGVAVAPQRMGDDRETAAAGQHAMDGDPIRQ